VNTEDDDDPHGVHIISDGKESDKDEDDKDGYAFGNKGHGEDLGNNPFGILAESNEGSEHEHALLQGEEDNASEQYSNSGESLDVTIHQTEEGCPKGDNGEDKGAAAGVQRSKKEGRRSILR
jgi:hypothetical protein